MFYSILGWIVFWISLVLAVVLFIKYKKIFPVFYLTSVSLYIFTAGFMIDVFDLGKFGILSILVVSAVLFMLVGYYLSHAMGNEIVTQDEEK